MEVRFVVAVVAVFVAAVFVVVVVVVVVVIAAGTNVQLASRIVPVR